jgi:hypothetical protein
VVTQSAPQSMPSGALVTTPAPVPAALTVSSTPGTTKRARTSLAASIVNLHCAAEPEAWQSASQRTNVEPGAAAAVRVTVASRSNTALHCPGQATPSGSETTVPAPAPTVCTVRPKAEAEKPPPTRTSPSIVTVQTGSVPTHAPRQPVKLACARGVATKVTEVPRK